MLQIWAPWVCQGHRLIVQVWERLGVPRPGHHGLFGGHGMATASESPLRLLTEPHQRRRTRAAYHGQVLCQGLQDEIYMATDLVGQYAIEDSVDGC